MYQLFNDPESGKLCAILYVANGVYKSIPLDPANEDYRTYLAWLAQGNTPKPAAS